MLSSPHPSYELFVGGLRVSETHRKCRQIKINKDEAIKSDSPSRIAKPSTNLFPVVAALWFRDAPRLLPLANPSTLLKAVLSSGELMHQHSNDALDWFFSSIEPYKAAYSTSTCTFIARRTESGTTLLRARLVLSPIELAVNSRIIQAGPYYACHYSMADVGLSIKTFLDQLASGYLTGPDRTFVLKTSETLSFHRTPHQPQTSSQERIVELWGMLPDQGQWNTIDSSWALRAAETPYNDINDLIADFGLHDVAMQLHLAALPPVAVATDSKVTRDQALLKLHLAKRLDPTKAGLGAIVVSRQGVELRKRFSGNELNWEGNDASKGLTVSLTLTVPKASVVHCFASYEGQCHHDYWVGDPQATLNPLRTILEEFDPGLEKIKSFMNRSSQRASSRDQESATAWLLWALGFSPLHLGAGINNVPDIVAVSTDGNFLVVECTSSGLKTDNKLQLLLDPSECGASLPRADQ